MTITAQLIATLMQQNCDAHIREEKSRDEWSAEQKRLWKLAANQCVASEVLWLVVPSMGGAR